MHLRGTMAVNGQGHLEIGGCDTTELVARFGTPLYVLDEAAIRRSCREYVDSFAASYGGEALVLYAGKAFLTTGFCKLIGAEGLGVDVCSGGELFTALAAGFPPELICMHGNNKGPQELELALSAGIGRIIVDNLTELQLLNELAGRSGVSADILLRITPGVEAHTHSYIQTGQLDSKFGIPLAGGGAQNAVREAMNLPHIILRGIHCHIGSQIFDLDSFDAAVELMAQLAADLKADLGFETAELNLGGGLGIRYTEGDTPPPVPDYIHRLCQAVESHWHRRGMDLPRLSVEPGRSIVGEAGTTLYTVGTIKDIPGLRRYVAVDGGMADNARVALYQAVYEACLANKADRESADVVSIAGKCCESGDMLIWDTSLPPVAAGDILAVFSTGAYNYSMASNYNRLARPAAVLVHEGQADLLIRRESYEDLVRHDVIPARLAGSREAESRIAT